jgi:alkylation response protein AidB-like acyl-CoA dehydrogenase
MVALSIHFLHWKRVPREQGSTEVPIASSYPQGNIAMSATSPIKITAAARSASEIARELGPVLASRAEARADEDVYVADNIALLKTSGLVEAGVPRVLGGGGADVDELAAMLRTLAYHCGSTGLAFSMHTHQVAVNAWRLKHQKAPVAPLLEKVARDQILILSTGGGDWLDGSGDAVPVEGGFRVNARKPFSSGSPAGTILSTSAVVRDANTVIHFGVPMSTQGISIKPTWRTMGMRSTASNDVALDNVFVPDSAVALRRPQGKWHMLFHVITMLAFPLIYGVYLGVAEAARERALALVRKRRPDEHLLQTVGEMENQLEAARATHAQWVAFGKDAEPGPATSSKSMVYRTLVARSVLGTVDAAMDVAGGASFFRANGLERLFRDAQGARYHPLQEGLQKALAARVALGLDIDAR